VKTERGPQAKAFRDVTDHPVPSEQREISEPEPDEANERLISTGHSIEPASLGSAGMKA
jgi:hypothetical protein